MNAGGSALQELCRAVPKGRAELDYEELRILSKLTQRLIVADALLHELAPGLQATVLMTGKRMGIGLLNPRHTNSRWLPNGSLK